MLSSNEWLEMENSFNELLDIQNKVFMISPDNLEETTYYITNSPFAKEKNRLMSLLILISKAFLYRRREKKELIHLLDALSKYTHELFSVYELLCVFSSTPKISKENKEFIYLLTTPQSQKDECRNIKLKKNSKLYEIIIEDDVETLQGYLSLSNLSINIKTDEMIFGNNPSILGCALFFDSSKIVTFLRLNNVIIDKKIDARYAIAGGNYNAIHFVIDSGCKIDFRDLETAIQYHRNEVAIWIHDEFSMPYTESMLIKAIKANNCQMVKNISECKCCNYVRSFYYSCKSSTYEIFLFIFSLLKEGEQNINHQKLSNLQVTVLSGKSRFVQYLLDKDKNKKTDITQKTKKTNDTLLHLAAMNGNIGTLKALLSYPTIADDKSLYLNAKNWIHQTPLHVAVIGKKFECVKYLISLEEVNVNAITLSGWTALHFAVDNEDMEIIKLFCLKPNKKIDFSIKDRFGESPLDMAEIQNKDNISEILKSTFNM